MNAVLGLMPPEVAMSEKTQAEARDDWETKNRIVRECLTNDEKRRVMNDAMASTIKREVYDFSLARVLLMPHLVEKDTCPTYAEVVGHGPVVVAHLVQQEKRVLDCRAFRDSVREEESVTTVRDIEFIPMRGHGIRPSSFPISNVTTLRWPDLNGNAYARVEQARLRLRDSLAQDETRVALRVLFWVCSKFGRVLWSKSVGRSAQSLRNAVESIGLDKNPVILCSVRNVAQALSICKIIGTPKDRKVMPMIGFQAEDAVVPVYLDASVPDWALFVVPSGKSLGEMPIFIQPQVQSYDKPERLIKGWLCFQDQGLVFTGTGLTNVVYLGWRGFAEMAKNILKRAVAWR